MMTKEEFKQRWESDESGGGITYNDIADCYVHWGLGPKPRIELLNAVVYSVLIAAQVEDAEEYK